VDAAEDETAVLEARYHGLLRPRPTSIFVIAPCTGCNLRCPYCYEQTLTPRPGAMSAAVEDRVVAFVERVMAAPAKTQAVVKFFGGEPLLMVGRCRSIAARLDRALRPSNKTLVTWIQTNGTLIDGDTFATPFAALRCVELTIDGPRRLHDTIRVGPGGQPTFDTIVNAARVVSGRDIPVVLRINAADPELLREALDDLAAGGLLALPQVSFYDGRVTDCFADYTSGRDQAGSLEAERDVIRGSLAVRALLRDSPWRRKYQTFPIFSKTAGPCAFNRPDNFCIDAHGDLYLCVFQLGVEAFKVGTLADDGRPVFNAAYAEIMGRSPFGHDDCVACRCLPICWGGCFAKAFIQKGSFAAPFCGTLPLIARERFEAGLAGGDL
jgi:uncharacterized protein